jgi:hypothetical protein
VSARKGSRFNLTEGMEWHSFRQRFATELKDTSLNDLRHLGGWKDPATILKCYQFPDADRMLESLEDRRHVYSTPRNTRQRKEQRRESAGG